MNSQFIAAAGTYFVMSRLSMNEIHASCTFGNSPAVDILASSADGSKSISIQVKSAIYAQRWRGKGDYQKVHHLEWALGKKAAKICSENLFFAFVDLKIDENVPVVYIIPSKFIFDFCKEWVDVASWVRFHPEEIDIEEFKENWDLIKNALNTR